MATTDDRRAAGVLMALAIAGLLVRIVTGDTAPPGAIGYRPAAVERPGADSLASRAGRLLRPLRPGETVDVDVAPAEELARLPRIGAGVAARIVADREANGPFGSLEGLERVSGIGGRTLEVLRPKVAFSGRARRQIGDRRTRIRVNIATAAELERLPGIGPALAAAIVDERTRNGPFRRPDDLARVRGIGARLVARLRGRILLP
jgi:competence protein ComEA